MNPATRRLWADLVIDPEPYCDEHRAMLADSHYLALPPPGCLFALAVRPMSPGIGGPIGAGPLLGVCLVGRPVARLLPQDGSVGEVTRLVLRAGLPFATASAVLRRAAEIGGADRLPRPGPPHGLHLPQGGVQQGRCERPEWRLGQPPRQETQRPGEVGAEAAMEA